MLAFQFSHPETIAVCVGFQKIAILLSFAGPKIKFCASGVLPAATSLGLWHPRGFVGWARAMCPGAALLGATQLGVGRGPTWTHTAGE